MITLGNMAKSNDWEKSDLEYFTDVLIVESFFFGTW